MPNKYGFWIIPENNTYKKFEEIIEKYCQKLGTPCFIPHMTIHGVVESTDEAVVKTIEKVAEKKKPFEVEVGITEFSSTYFQCVFSRIRTSSKLVNLHMPIREAFRFTDKHVYMPHASLVYGDIDMETREVISNEVNLSGQKFEVSKISIVRADTSDPDEWNIVDQVNLT